MPTEHSETRTLDDGRVEFVSQQYLVKLWPVGRLARALREIEQARRVLVLQLIPIRLGKLDP